MNEVVEILKFKPEFRKAFKDLNIEWIEKYFTVEPEDDKVLSNPEVIIKNGGEIFFAKYNNEIVGTCAAIKIDDNTIELAKMAVTEKAQGKQIGKKLALAVIEFARSKGVEQLVLETSDKLVAAVNLYEKLGFEKINENSGSKYTRTVFKMVMEL